MVALNSPLHPKALRYLAAVAQLGSVQAAAREVSISASAIDSGCRLPWKGMKRLIRSTQRSSLR